MKIPTILLAAALALAAAAPLSAANSYQLKMTAVNGKLSYAHSQKNEAGTQNDFAGKAEAKTEKKPDIVFKSLLKETKGGVPVLNYTFELAGEEAGLPVMRAASEVALVPGKKILAAVYGPWRYYLELEGRAPKPGDAGNYQLSAELACGQAVLPVRVAALKGSRAEISGFSAEGGKKRKLYVSLLPGLKEVKGGLELQYSAALTEDGAAAGAAEGKAELLTGLLKTVPAGENCKISLKAVGF
ncbi:MAG TPA: hypothetical protein DCZ92_13770 [Elusimicrobia bacterium]|nr:hypothetical protein [Elusimicrobiota bacterium]